jgi:glycosyltransferase involved in cell wall biosynthesis
VQSATGRLPLRYLFEPRQGKGFALQRLAREGRGEWLILLDDDVRVEPDLIEQYERAIAAHPEASFFGGQVLPWVEGGVGRGLNGYLIRVFPWVHAVLRLDGDLPIAPGDDGQKPHGPNMMVRRYQMLGEGTVDPRIGMFGGKRVSGSDTQLALNLLARGRSGWLVAGPKVHHFIPRQRAGLRWFCQWHAGIGHRRAALRGPAPAGTLGLRAWVWKLIAWRLVQAAARFRPADPRRAWETLADACVWWGYLCASIATDEPRAEGMPEYAGE